ncbi:hypothetical protein ACFS5M_01890 [Lacinutrix iliipiscaria]|uniref:Uncharacterized protein n=1 Tax=Lacinutrix iliipiscaria TaxID=1230532 RepID=A0ABW5WML5_9FLAO
MRFLIIILSVFSLNTQSLNFDAVRDAYKVAANDKTKVESFHKLLSKVNKEDNAVLIAYKGASIALLAKHAKTIKEKKEGFIEGVSFIEYAIEKSPDIIEVRFVRLSIQENSPKLLKYKSNLEEDKQFLLAQFKNIKFPHLKNHIKDYISQSKVFTDEEKSVILGS